MPPPAGPAPVRVRLRMYGVGFGDCFLLSFEYAAPLPDGRSVRHILIDFGTTSRPKHLATLLPIARRIAAHTNGGELDVVLVSHRHRDHISAFGAADIPPLLAKVGYPKLVVRSWTEHPSAKPRAKGAALAAPAGLPAAVGDRSLGFLATLEAAEKFGEALEARTRRARGRSLAAAVHRMAFGQLKNPEAVAQLRKWAKKGDGTYLHYGMPSGIESVVPGITVHVLGPPTVDQYPEVASQRSRDADEFWMLYRGLARQLSPADIGVDPSEDEPFGAPGDASSEESASVEPDAAATEAPRASHAVGDPGPVRWLTDQLSRQQVNSLMRIVRILDDVLNNTSVILLFEVPGARPLKLLFPGDAQIENWEYALKKVPAAERKANLELLRRIDLYKVGHHGSRNATPRTLFNLWNEEQTISHPMTVVLSTKASVHGESIATAVPRKTLVAALDTRAQHMYSTQKLTKEQLFYELVADLTTTDGFIKVAGP